MGLGYLAIGAWIYRARGATPAGRALAFFCFAAAAAQGLYFDIYSTHVGTPVWAIAIAALGGALLSLAMRFPQPARIVQRYPGHVRRALPGFDRDRHLGRRFTLRTVRPWEYLVARDVSYRYTGIGGLLFLGTMFFRAFQGREATVRRQARIVLLGQRHRVPADHRLDHDARRGYSAALRAGALYAVAGHLPLQRRNRDLPLSPAGDGCAGQSHDHVGPADGRAGRRHQRQRHRAAEDVPGLHG